ncbi:MAG: hypothetical protein MUE68_08775 [Bacteroidetes bacterium]|jgi:hypothetical protein|nr:hypothetical protein [Bacteroidota bacterium]
MKTTFILAAMAASVIFLGCPTDPPDPVDGLNPRDFTWVRDSIGDGNATFVPLGLYGSSPTNVYFVNPHGDLWGNKLWRFNGQTWTDISQVYADAYNSKGLVTYPWAPQAIHGFDANDIWVVGGRDTAMQSLPDKQGFVLRYLNGTWGVTEIPNSHLLVSIWGSSPSNVLVGEFEGGLYHFNGQHWTNVSNDDSVSKAHIVGVSPNEAYIGGVTLRQGRLFSFLYRWNGTNLTQLDVTETTFGTETFTELFSWYKGGLVSTATGKVQRRTSAGTWETMYSTSPGSFAATAVYGQNDLLAVGNFRTGELVMHYNGKDWFRIPSLNRTDLYYYRAYQVGDQVFLLGIPRGFNLKAYITRGIPK